MVCHSEARSAEESPALMAYADGRGRDSSLASARSEWQIVDV